MGASVIDTPADAEGITAAWLADATGFTLDAVDVEAIGGGNGFMGRLFRVRTHSSDTSCPASVIVKLPTDDPGAKFIGEMTRVWEREHACYRDVVPSMNIRVPRAYANVESPPCLVLEDLSAGVQGDHVAGATHDQAERAIDVLARHHAAWFEHPLLPTLTWMPGLDDPGIHMLAATFAVGWPQFLDRYGDTLPTRCLRWCERFVDGIPAWIAGHLDDPWTMTHGDYRLDNLFFFDDGSVAVIDWQLSMRAPGQADLVYFCANNLTVDARRAMEDSLITRYVDGLHRDGVPSGAVNVDSVRRGYLEGLLFYAVSFGASLLTIDPANERGVALFDALVARTFAAVDDHSVGERMGFGAG
jgi:hypothetical protein